MADQIDCVKLIEPHYKKTMQARVKQIDYPLYVVKYINLISAHLLRQIPCSRIALSGGLSQTPCNNHGAIMQECKTTEQYLYLRLKF